MVRILDLDSMASGDITDDNFIIIGNTPNTFGVKKIRMVDALGYFTTNQSVDLNTVISTVDSAVTDLDIEGTARSSLSISGNLTYNSSTGVFGYVQPTNVSDFANDAGYLTDADTLNEAEARLLIDSDYVQLKQDYNYSSLTGTPTNVSDFANDAGYLTDANTLDSGEAIALIDSAYVQSKQDYNYSSLTNVPTNISTFTNDVGYLTATDTLDSAEAQLLIDSAYINARVIIPEGYADADVIALVDSAYVHYRIGEVGIDSSSIIDLIDSAYVQFRSNESYITGITDPKYVDLSGDSMTGTLWVDGDIYASGNITGFSSFSDITLKENLEIIQGAVSKIQKLSGYTFNYKKQPNKRIPGVVAQEVEEVLPEAVYQTQDGKKAVLYGNMIALLIESVKELKDEIDDLKGKIT